MDAKLWAENLTKEVYEEWKNKYPNYENGFKVFYSVPHEDPELMIISFQPGGNHTHFREENFENYLVGDFSINENSYIGNNHKMSKMVRRLFSHIENGLILLEKSTIIPLIFFRASSVEKWENEAQRENMEKFCFEKLAEVLSYIKPKKILIIGFKTFNKLNDNKILKFSNKEIFCTRSKNGDALAFFCNSGDVKVFVTTHLSGSRISNIDMERLSESFSVWCKKL